MTLAEHIVNALLEIEFSGLKTKSQPIRIRTADGRLVIGQFNGYYDMSFMGKDSPISIGYPDSYGSYTHGSLHPGDKIMSPVPSFDEWKASMAEPVGVPAKACFWPTM